QKLLSGGKRSSLITNGFQDSVDGGACRLIIVDDGNQIVLAAESHYARKLNPARWGAQSAMKAMQSSFGIMRGADSQLLGHSDQLSQRFSLHLVHDPAA